MEQISDPRAEQGGSAASWSAIIAGAFVAAAVSLALLALGAGCGFAAVSPWPGLGVSVKAFATTAAIWFVVTQWLSSGLGGYITGRLRRRWIGTHTHEVFFRDTAHGLVTWAVATVIVSVALVSSLVSLVGSGAHGATEAASEAAIHAYGTDRLFRTTNSPVVSQSLGDPRVEAGRIAANAWATGSVPDADRSYLVELVAARTGVPSEEARRRVEVFLSSALEAQAKLKADADAARKAAARAAIFTALSMLIGAFIASVSAALGGRQRDEHL
jgi:hypothetical protein